MLRIGQIQFVDLLATGRIAPFHLANQNQCRDGALIVDRRVQQSLDRCERQIAELAGQGVHGRGIEANENQPFAVLAGPNLVIRRGRLRRSMFAVCAMPSGSHANSSLRGPETIDRAFRRTDHQLAVADRGRGVDRPVELQPLHLFTALEIEDVQSASCEPQ